MSKLLTYCNPLPIPSYPKGINTHFYTDERDFRSLADPTCVYYDNKWYLYISHGMVWVSEDFVNWEYHPLNVSLGYAPTVVHFKGKFYLTSNSVNILYVSDNPCGPFELVGEFKNVKGERQAVPDPMLFADDDGRLYVYFGSGYPGIFGAELDPENPTQLLCDPVLLMQYQPENVWERLGQFNENPNISYPEGSWMYKKNGRYYLTFGSPATQHATYAMGAYVSDEGPLSGFRYQKHNPFALGRYGLVSGAGHGSVVDGPNDTIWVFYTSICGIDNQYERRIGMDPAYINEEGELVCERITCTPQWAPGVKADPGHGNDAEQLPLNCLVSTQGSSRIPGNNYLYAVDECMHTFWQPADDDCCPKYAVNFGDFCMIEGIRVIWHDEGLDYENGILPGPYKYKIEVSEKHFGPWNRFGEKDDEEMEWVTLIDRSQNDKDMMIDYIPVEPTRAHYMRLTLLEAPKGIHPGLVNFMAFGHVIPWNYKQVPWEEDVPDAPSAKK